MSLADRVKKRRIELDLTQDAAAESAGIRQQSWAAIEEGKTKKPRNILGIAKALSVDANWLLNGGDMIPVSDINLKRIPVISYVQAGALANRRPVDAIDDIYEYVLTDSHTSDKAFALKVCGDSMQPDFQEGDVIVIDPEVEPMPGEFVVAANGDFEATFKKYRPTMSIDGSDDFELVPLNSDYPVIKCTFGKVRIIGTMIEHRIYRRKR